MAKITDTDKLNINISYAKLHSYAAVSRELGFSASTIKKYVVKDFSIPNEAEIKRFSLNDIPDKVDLDMFTSVENLGDLLVMSDEEYDEVKELWKEMSL